MSEDLVLRAATPDDTRERAALAMEAFLDDVDDEGFERRQLVMEPERDHVITDDGRVVATVAVYSREMTVPGVAVPTAHVTGVVVVPTHRRRGLLTRLMNAQLRAVRDRGVEPIAALWASESAIYGRFGYGLASWHVEYKIPTLATSVPGVTEPGRLRRVEPAQARDELAEIFERARHLRPGMSSRPRRWWEYRTADPVSRRHGMSAARGVLYEVGGRAEGYALWRTGGGWGESGPDGKVSVLEVVTETTEAYVALWRFLLSIDLVRTVTFSFASVDEPLAHLVTNAEALTSSLGTGLWVRIVDVALALSSRRYSVPLDVVLEVSDRQLPENTGRWRLVGDAVSAKCEPTDAAPDLSLDVSHLGSAYLGGVSLGTLAAAGQVTEHRPGTIAATSAAFGWHRQPAPIEIF